MKTIPLTQGYVTIVDDEDYDKFHIFRWHVHCWSRYCYAARNIPCDGKYILSKMHREIFGLNQNEGIVDHKNKDTLDNRRNNLRVTTKSINGYNRKFHANNRSGYRGVSWIARDKLWLARINVDCREIRCGSFKDILSAAKAYDLAAVKYYGPDAFLNFPGGNL